MTDAAHRQPKIAASRYVISEFHRTCSCAMVLVQATTDLRKVLLWLGHAQMQTTEVYRGNVSPLAVYTQRITRLQHSTNTDNPPGAPEV